MHSSVRTGTLGFPRIGHGRALKKAVEAYWSGKASLPELEAAGKRIRKERWIFQRDAGIDLIASNDFSFYDPVLDLSCLLGNVPKRFRDRPGLDGLDTAFLMARGEGGGSLKQPCGCGQAAAFACEMTKWFDTNYHYIVPEFDGETSFALSGSKVFEEFEEALQLGIRSKPVLIGPITYLALGKGPDGFDRWSLLPQLVSVYREILTKLAAQGAEWVQMDEPILALDLEERERSLFGEVYGELAEASSAKLMVAAYFGELRENLDTFVSLPVAGLHYDAVRGRAEFSRLLERWPVGRVLSLGVVDGRNVWKNNYAWSVPILRRALERVGAERLIVSPSCSLAHVPLSLGTEAALDGELKGWLAFAEEKLAELADLRTILGGGGREELAENRESRDGRDASRRIHDPEIADRVRAVRAEDSRRASPYPVRRATQRERLKLPAFPTTTIGSFPQTGPVRSARAKLKKGTLGQAEYDGFIREEIRRCVTLQEEIGIDMPVHGEFERNDMVEYFGERLEGFAFTEHGWVQSYGSRCVKPPILFGDVSRPRPMTVEWSSFARGLTDLPMKGMLTGPITILQWSFVRDDQPRRDTARQIALAIRDEVRDLEAAGLAAIQIDEPALREGLPLRRSDWAEYLEWAAEAFRLSASVVRDDTQIHTHMCYAEFNDIISSIASLDADVITIETSRSNMELLNAFAHFDYPNEIGPGVYDIHSPRVPTVEEMLNLMNKAAAVIPSDRLWVNPDCGLKTRGWPETEAALRRMVEAARRLRG